MESSEVGITVHTSDGSFMGTHVLVTPHVGILSKIAFEPALPEWKSARFGRIGQGQVAEALILLKEPLPLPKEASKLAGPNMFEHIAMISSRVSITSLMILGIVLIRRFV